MSFVLTYFSEHSYIYYNKYYFLCILCIPVKIFRFRGASIDALQLRLLPLFAHSYDDHSSPALKGAKKQQGFLVI